MALNLNNLKKTINILDQSIASAISRADDEFYDVVRAGIILNFEKAFQECVVSLKKWISRNCSPADVLRAQDIDELFSLAEIYGLVPDPLPWYEYYDLINKVSHAYDAEQAAAVYESAEFLVLDARYLLGMLERPVNKKHKV